MNGRDPDTLPQYAGIDTRSRLSSSAPDRLVGYLPSSASSQPYLDLSFSARGSVGGVGVKLHQFEMLGVGRAMLVHLVIGDKEDPAASRQWLEATVEIPVKGTMDEEGLRTAAMTVLRDALNDEIAALRSGPLG